MSDNIYKVVELVGSSTVSIEDAVQNGIRRASRTLRHLRWFEVVETRGQIKDGEIAYYQVTMKVGLTLEEDDE